MPTADACDVVIIGAGVIGCSTAYHLARMGITNVVVLEKEEVGSGSSSKSAAMLSIHSCDDDWSLRLVRYSCGRYMQFEDEVGESCGFRRTGWLSIADRPGAPEVERKIRLLQRHSVPVEVLSPDDIRRYYPEMRVDDLASGAYTPDDGTLDPHSIMWGYLRRAREMGVRLLQGARATGLHIRKGRVEGVRTDKGFLATRTVVNAAGPWAPEVGRWAGVEIPILNRARCIWVTGPFPFIPSDRPFVDDVGQEWYFRPEGPGLLIGMGIVPVDRLDVEISRQLLPEMIEVATHRVPLLEQATILTSWTGIRPLTPDGLPIIGPVPAPEGLLLNVGWGGMGLMQAPVAGQLLAEYLAFGRPVTFPDAVALDIGRFGERWPNPLNGGSAAPRWP
ncbi:MAG: FAD-binding oxidoreductase [Chloroflexi bacterium]|nr:FAD-binding oxidoreductase [Chloroflexota bacterium]